MRAKTHTFFVASPAIDAPGEIMGGVNCMLYTFSITKNFYYYWLLHNPYLLVVFF